MVVTTLEFSGPCPETPIVPPDRRGIFLPRSIMAWDISNPSSVNSRDPSHPPHPLSSITRLPLTLNMASDASVADSLDTLAAKLVEKAKDLRAGNSTTPQQHEALVGTLKQVQDAVYLPRDDLAAMQMGFVTAAAIRLLLHWKVFEKIPDTGSIRYEELATQVGGDVVIISQSSPSDSLSHASRRSDRGNLSPDLLASRGDGLPGAGGKRPGGTHGQDTPVCRGQSPSCLVADGVSGIRSIPGLWPVLIRSHQVR